VYQLSYLSEHDFSVELFIFIILGFELLAYPEIRTSHYTLLPSSELEVTAQQWSRTVFKKHRF
jgi:hypothetical protein